MALTITKAYAAGSALMESHIDNFRTGLHTQFNTDKFDSTQFAGAMALTSAKFSGSVVKSTDNTNVDFGTGGAASLGLDSSKNFVFNTTAATTEMQFFAGSTWYLEFWTDKVYVPGDIIIAKGNANRTILQCLSSYKKPVIEWASSTAVNIQNNSSSSNETILFFPTFVAAVEENTASTQKYRQASINNVANGYGTAHTGVASGGRRVGVDLVANSWYAVYAVKLRSGTDYNATTSKFILVYDTTLPYAANEATLDGYYGTGCWLYLGLVRYGHGATGSSTSIIRFVYSNKGWCYFYDNDSGATAGGLTLAQSTTDADDSGTELYKLVSGMTGAAVPDLVGHVQINVQRQKVSDWLVKDSNGETMWRGGWQTEDTSSPHGFIIEIPFVSVVGSEYKFCQTRKGTGAVDKRVVLTGFSDGFRSPRRQGHGI